MQSLPLGRATKQRQTSDTTGLQSPQKPLEKVPEKPESAKNIKPAAVPTPLPAKGKATPLKQQWKGQSSVKDGATTAAKTSKQTTPAGGKTATPLTAPRPETRDQATETIFRDGTLVLRDGSVVRNASILSDGSVKLKDGSTLSDVTIVLDSGTILTDAKIMRDGTILKDGSIVTVGRIVKDGTVLSDGTVVKGKQPVPNNSDVTSKENTKVSSTPPAETPAAPDDAVTSEAAQEAPAKEKTALQLLKEQMEEKRKSS